MRLSKLHVQNYRCFDVQQIDFDNFTSFVGPNGSGKSTVLMALNVFFRNAQAPSDVINLQEEDFHSRNTAVPIKITCTFDDLSTDACADLKAYVRQGLLTISAIAVWNPDSAKAEVQQFGVRQVMRNFTPFFEAFDSGKLVTDLKSIYSGLANKYADLPAVTVKNDMHDALRAYEEANPNLCEAIESSDQFYGWSKGANRIAKYVQWVYLPAVKDAAEEQDEQRNTALGSLLQRGIRAEVDFSEPLEELRRRTTEDYRTLIEGQNEILNDLASKIEVQLKNWAHTGARVELGWHFDEQKSVSVAQPFARARVGEGGFLGEIVRSGHGMQRSFLVAILQVLATIDVEQQPTLLLGFEEPELYQHPPQARHLASLLEQLSLQDAQVVITTHSPYFISSKGYECVRLVRGAIAGKGATITRCKYNQLCEKLADALGDVPQQPSELIAAISVIMQPSHSELFFCKVVVLLEGAEDVAFLSSWLKHNGLWDDFRRLGCHFIPCDGKTNMSRPLVIADALGLPTFTIFDGDCDKITENKNDEHRRDNACLLKLVKSAIEPKIEENVYGSNFVMWSTRILDEVRNSVGDATWDAAEDGARDAYKLQSGVKRKNPVLVAATVESLLNDKIEITPLLKAGNALLAFARSANE